MALSYMLKHNVKALPHIKQEFRYPQHITMFLELKNVNSSVNYKACSSQPKDYECNSQTMS